MSPSSTFQKISRLHQFELTILASYRTFGIHKIISLYYITICIHISPVHLLSHTIMYKENHNSPWIIATKESHAQNLIRRYLVLPPQLTRHSGRHHFEGHGSSPCLRLGRAAWQMLKVYTKYFESGLLGLLGGYHVEARKNWRERKSKKNNNNNNNKNKKSKHNETEETKQRRPRRRRGWWRWWWESKREWWSVLLIFMWWRWRPSRQVWPSKVCKIPMKKMTMKWCNFASATCYHSLTSYLGRCIQVGSGGG